MEHEKCSSSDKQTKRGSSQPIGHIVVVGDIEYRQNGSYN